MALKYLFRATFADGSVINQNQEDQSLLNPQRSRYYDLQFESSPLVTFELLGPDGRLLVDLRDGHFELPNGARSSVPSDIPPGGEYELLFFRDHLHNFTSGLQEIGHQVKYRVGWTYRVNDKTYQNFVEVE